MLFLIISHRSVYLDQGTIVGFPLENQSALYYSTFLKRTLNYSKSGATSNEIIVIKKMIVLNVMHDASMNKEIVQKIANVIIAFGYYHREIKKNR